MGGVSYGGIFITMCRFPVLPFMPSLPCCKVLKLFLPQAPILTLMGFITVKTENSALAFISILIIDMYDLDK
jgi:hypothetical protein